MSIVMAKQKKSLSRVDIFKEEIDQIFIKSGLKPSVWEYKKVTFVIFHQEGQ
jgi:hypothetical protein